MALAELNFDAINEVNLAELISTGAQEGVRIEYKRGTYGTTDADKKEYLKDATSFANSMGGYLILGMEEAEGVPVRLTPIPGDADAELQRLENLIRDAVEPRIGGVRMRTVPVSGGGFVVIIFVPRSWNGPHRVSFKGSSRFFGRTSAGAYELGVEELRSKFNASASAFDRAARFRERRLALIAAGDGIVPLASEGGRLVLHMFPLGSTGEQAVDLEQALTAGSDLLKPIAAASWSSQFNFEGFANVRSGEPSFGYTQLFRDGSLEATKVRITATNDGVKRIPARSFGDPLVDSVSKYASALEILGVSAPLLVMISLEGVRGAHLGHSQFPWIEDSATIRKDVLELPPVMINEYSGPAFYEAALRPAFDALWNAGGLARCTYFNEEGRWQPPN